MQIIASSEQHAQRLDIVVAAAMPRLSRAFVRKLSEQGKVLVAGESVKMGYKVREGDLITVDYDEDQLGTVPDIDLPVIYEDDDCIVINKPAGVLTHAQSAHVLEGTVASFLRNKVAKDVEHSDRAGIVHRLDRATSGVIIGAKTAAALSDLQKQFAQRRTKKTYIAIAAGHFKEKEAIIDMAIERNPKAPATFRVGPNGKPSTTHYKVLEENDTHSLVELKPETGRTHQLRVHLAQIGHPIVGDPLYGGAKYGDRLYLHAKSLEVTLPTSRERKIFTVPVPKEFKDFMDQ